MNVPKCSYREVKQEDVDGHLFKSTSHGLDADFIYLFDYVIQNYQFGHDKELNMPPTILKTDKNSYHFSFDTGLTYLTIK